MNSYILREDVRKQEIHKLKSLADHFWTASTRAVDLAHKNRLTQRAFSYYNAAINLQSESING
jgi:hypothetical protein